MRDYVALLQRAVSCVSPTVVVHDSWRPAAGPEYSVGLSGNTPTRLRAGDAHLLLDANQRFRLLHADGSWWARTTTYAYAFVEESGAEILAFHWHPGTESFDDPHVHMSAGAGRLRQELQHAHIPTRLLTLAEVIEFAIRDLKVAPIRDDYRRVLELARTSSESALVP